MKQTSPRIITVVVTLDVGLRKLKIYWHGDILGDVGTGFWEPGGEVKETTSIESLDLKAQEM